MDGDGIQWIYTRGHYSNNNRGHKGAQRVRKGNRTNDRSYSTSINNKEHRFNLE